MADVDTLLDFDSPSLSSAHQAASYTAAADDKSASVMDPFSPDNFQVKLCAC